MSSQVTPNGRRLVTACAECHRRKQKCDRRNPCNFCIARKVPSKCLYGNRLRPTRASATPEDRPRADGSVGSNARDRSTTYGLPLNGADQFSGHEYSFEADRNRLPSLANLLRDDEANPGASTLDYSVIEAPYSNGPRSFHGYLPPTPAIHDLVDIFFAQYNPQLHILEKCYFRDLLSLWLHERSTPLKYLKPEDLIQELDSFPALLFQVLGLAVQVTSPDALVLMDMTKHELESAQAYSDIGIHLLRSFDMQRFTLVAVQAYLLRSSWLKNLGRGVESWHCLGVAIRHAQELGLHEGREIHQRSSDRASKTLSLFWYEEYKRRVWATVFIFDGLMTLMLRRPRMINIEDCDVKKPMDCDIPADRSAGVPFTVQDGCKPNAPTSTAAPLLLRELVCIVHETRAQKTSTPHPKDYSVITNLHNRAISLLDTAPPYLRPNNSDTSWDSEYPYLPFQRENLLSMTNLVITTLHRPHIGTHTESRTAALQAAITTLESQHRVFSQTPRHLYKLVGSSFCTIDAALLLCVMCTDMPYRDGLKQRVEQILEHSTERLVAMQEVSSVAKSGLQVLRECYRKLKGAHGGTENGPNSTATLVPENIPTVPVDSENIPGSNSFAPALDMIDTPSSLPLESDLLNLDLTNSVLPASNYFDTAFWLDHVGQIPLPASSLPGQDFVWDSLTFD
ncbi:fungal-specific transcription factor domain-containing protein [Leptodontidium sp. MPI-SDFR-AT-0119]|nr:fungal-specific transcription factor domain-containing protein [Leptodontidium sp. MPI-SDFR-AT-0119]